MDTLWQDLKYGLRQLRRNPGFTTVAVLTLALGIGANTAIFTLVNEVLLRPRPGIGSPEELVDIGRTQDGSGFDNFSYPNYVDFRDRNRCFSGLLGYEIEPRQVSLTEGDAAEPVFGALVSGNYFSVLQVTPALGRFFSPEEDRTPGTHAVMVLSYRYWQRRFAGDRAILGREIKINSHPFQVIGVAPEGFRSTMILAPDAWFPLMMTPVVIPGSHLLDERRDVWMVAIGRLKSGVTLQQARAEMNALAAQLEQEYPEDNRGKGVALYPSSLFPGEFQGMVGGFLALLMVIVGLVLLIASFNVAGMMLARATARQREIAVRLAVGANRGRLLRQLLTEGLLLFLAGGAAGLLVAVWMKDLLLVLLPQLPVAVELNLSLDWRVLGFTLLLSLLVGLLSTLAPALQASRLDLVTALKEDASGGSFRKPRLRQVLVLGQVAVSLVLLVAAGLFLRALQRAATMDPGFDPAGVEMVSLDLSLAGYQGTDGLAAWGQLLERVRALPGVRAASLAWDLPLDGGRRGLGGIEVPGHVAPDGGRVISADWNVVAPGYFQTLKIPLWRGRDFTKADREGAPRVAIINQTMAQRFWPGQDPVGQQILHADDEGNRPLEIIGVARDTKNASLGEAPELFVYVPLQQYYFREMTLVVRTENGARLHSDVRAAVRAINPNLPILHAQSLAEYTGIGLLPQRVAGWVATSLGLVGLLLASLGLYGVTAYSVSQRTREIGIRMALGAQRDEILRWVVGQAMVLVAVGGGVGLAVALILTRFLAGLLLGVGPMDWVTYAGVTLVLAAVSFIACYIPARRATRVDPLVALRYE